MRARTLVVVAATLCVMVLAACGGGGGGSPVISKPEPTEPTDPGPSGVTIALPQNHGLAAGGIRVAPGASRELGNVVVSCPAGGAVCTVTVAADGTASYERIGGVPAVMVAYGSWNLPPGHGLSAGEIRVVPGASRELGNVVVTCPAGGAACVVTVAADGTASYERTGGVPTVMAAYGSWNLPLGHGLSAGEIRVAPGASRELGNVAVSCPAGGAACVVTVAADGTASYARTGGTPSVTIWGHAQDNPTAQDLLDHWNDPQTLRSGLALSGLSRSDIAERKQDLYALLDVANGNPGNAGVRFRNVQPENVEIIGEKDGITYGQWKGGPAGTLNIEFDWRFGGSIDEATRIRMERAGKSWSRRIMDDFGMHVATTGTSFRHDETFRQLDEDVTTNGLVIFVLDKDPSIRDDYSSAAVWQFLATSNDFEPWFGSIRLDRRAYGAIRVMAHEIGHVLGIGINGSNFPSSARYVNRQDHTFEGPEAMQANGGSPVPFQWTRRVYDAERDLTYSVIAEPGAPGAVPDLGHIGVCTSVMSYCSDPAEPWTGTPGEIDFAILADLGYEISDAATASEPEVYGWGAWGRHSAWGAGAERTLVYESRGDRSVHVDDRLRAGADAFGIAPGTTLADNSALMGAVTWTGSLIGVDLGQEMLPPVFGDAQLRVELSSLQGTARFDSLTVFVGNEAAPFRSPSVEHAIEVTGNTFSDADNRISGGFFGGAHEEMAGVLDDRRSHVNLLAGFGGKR